MSTSNFVPAPLSRTMTITSDPVVLSYYAQKAEEFNAQNFEPEPEPVAVLLSEAEQEDKNKAMKAIFKKLRHTPAVLPRAASLSTDYPPAPAPLSRTESVRSYEPSGLRRTDYDDLTYEPGTTALMPTSGLSRAPSAPLGLSRAPSAMPGLFRAPTTMPTTLSTTEEE